MFLKKNLQNPCTSQTYSIPLPSLEFLCGALHIVWRCKLRYTAVRLPRVFLPFAVDHMRVLADEEVRAAFFVPYRQPHPTDSGIRLELL